jgi:hypothetical protein
MKLSLFFVAVFAGFTLFSAARNPWVVPAFAAFTFYWAVPPYVALRNMRGAEAFPLLFARFALMHYAIAWFIALIVANPTAGVFWLVFVGVLAISSPVVLLGGRYLLGDRTREGK